MIDRFGHTEGDHALTQVADALMKSCSQKNFFIARYGGDEFTVICELEQDQSIEDVCSRIHARMKETETSYPITVSIGYALYEDSIQTPQEFISLVDSQLYIDKKKGRMADIPLYKKISAQMRNAKDLIIH